MGADSFVVLCLHFVYSLMRNELMTGDFKEVSMSVFDSIILTVVKVVVPLFLVKLLIVAAKDFIKR